MPLLTTFLKSYAHPFLGLASPAASKQISATTEPGMLASDTSETAKIAFPPLGAEEERDELVEKDIRDRFKKMCEGYFEIVAKKLVLEHKVSTPGSLCEIIAISRLCRGCKSRIVGTTKLTFVQGRSSKTANKRTRR